MVCCVTAEKGTSQQTDAVGSQSLHPSFRAHSIFSKSHFIKIDLQEMRWGDMDWIDLAQYRDRLQALVMCGKELSGSIKRGEFLD